jgi:hypothetical protein
MKWRFTFSCSEREMNANQVKLSSVFDKKFAIPKTFFLEERQLISRLEIRNEAMYQNKVQL